MLDRPVGADDLFAHIAAVAAHPAYIERFRKDLATPGLRICASRSPPMQRVRNLANEVPWRQIVAARNRIVHGYLGIAPDTVWNILSVHLPALRQPLRALLAQIPPPKP